MIFIGADMSELTTNASLIPELSTENLDHLGLLVAAMNDLKLIETIDKLLPLSKQGGAQLSMGQRVAGMIVNGLGFVGTRLYMTPRFFENKPVKLLFGEDVEASHFNDDSLGRCLDGIYEYGPTKFLSNITIPIALEKGLLGKTIHTDTTTLTVYMKRDDDDDDDDVAEVEGLDNDCREDSLKTEENVGSKKDHDETKLPYIAPDLTCARPAYGYAKNKRMDLRQLVMLLTVTGKANFPIWAEAHDGNASDKVTLQAASQRVQSFCDNLEEAIPKLLCVADSASYESFLTNGSNLLWLSRVPASHKKAQEFLQKNETEIIWEKLDENYKFMSETLTYRNVEQRWCLIFSQAAFDREYKTMERQIKKEYEMLTKKLHGLSRLHFGCEKDARLELAKLEDAEKIIDYIQISTTLLQSQEKIKELKRTKGKFILATNQLNKEALKDCEVLSEYKKQSGGEGSFKFVKNDAFQVSKIFLKKDSRINALMIIMVLCLMVYNYAQYLVRKKLQEEDKTIPNQIKKPIQNPTGQYLFSLFQGVCVAKCKIGDQFYSQITRITALLRQIILLFGEDACKIYGICTT